MGTAKRASIPAPTVGQPRDLGEQLFAYASYPLFVGSRDAVLGPNPYRRPLSPERISDADFASPLTEADLSGGRSLLAQRLLCNLYESETVLLPEQGLDALRSDFDLFYSDQLRRLREGALGELERHAFGFLEGSVDVSGAWSAEALDAYFTSAVTAAEQADSEVLTAIAECREPEVAAETYLVQMALDGLTEASAMSRNLGGAYGPEQSALFKIFIDEFGYGVHDAKHTTIFGKLLRSRAMKTHVHAYWHFYLAAPLATNNYYYYLSRDHSKFFRYVGAVTYTEWVFAPGFVKMIDTYRDVFGADIDLHYCDEHAHIDQHHGRITREQLLLALAERHGPSVIPEMVRGIAEATLLGRLFEADTAAQIRWADAIDHHCELGEKALADGLAGPKGGSGRLADAPPAAELIPDTPFDTRSHETATVLTVEAGEIDVVVSATGRPRRLSRGDSLLVPQGRVYGLRTTSSQAVYRSRPVGHAAAEAEA